MKTLNLSIIIPTYNEEKYLGNLLKDIHSQVKVKPLEIIVADANSTDRTKGIAKQFGAKVIKGGLPGIGRNNGAKESKGGILLFLDADTRLPKDFLDKSYGEFLERELAAATVDNIPKTQKQKWLYLTIYFFHNKFIRMISKIEPHATGTCLFVKKDVFEKLKGFDEGIPVFEDSEFVKRVFKMGFLFRVLNSTKIFVSIRRFEKKGVLKSIFKVIFGSLKRKFKGEIRKKEFYWD